MHRCMQFLSSIRGVRSGTLAAMATLSLFATGCGGPSDTEKLANQGQKVVDDASAACYPGGVKGAYARARKAYAKDLLKYEQMWLDGGIDAGRFSRTPYQLSLYGGQTCRKVADITMTRRGADG